MVNFADHPESIRAVAARLLKRALDTPAAPQAAACGDKCEPRAPLQVVYRVEPTVFLAPERQQALCLKLEQSTAADPLAFPNKEFKSVDELNAWIMDFSQGRGVEGKQLYAQCGANCSPRYTFLIAPVGGSLRVQSRVLCGRARDRASDQYSVSTALRASCAPRLADALPPSGS